MRRHTSHNKSNTEKRGKTKHWNKNQLNKEILSVFSKNSHLIMNYRQVSKKLNVKGDDFKQRVYQGMMELSQEGFLEEIAKGRYRYIAQQQLIEGIVDLTAKGSAYIICDELEEDVFVSQKHLNHALNGDRVSLFLYAKRRGAPLEGQVVEVLERSKTEFVGTLEISKGFAFVVADSNQMPYDIFINSKEAKKARNGEKVVVKISDWPQKAKSPIGEIISVLGFAGENETEMNAIMVEFGLPYEFPDKVIEASEQIKDGITQEEIKKRKDFRSHLCFTIDPFDAKDFDDAISFKELENNQYEIGVHIADVSHYITPGSVLDQEAVRRATSVYLVDRVVPMLPERLSNGICSLRPNEDKLCFSAVFQIDENAQVIKEWFGRTIIRSQHRLSYEQAQEMIEGGEGAIKDELLIINGLAKKIRQRRFEQGSIAFDKTEVKFELDEDGHPIGIFLKESKEAHQLIEEFMLLANKKVAEKIGKVKAGQKAKTFVYRVHDTPNQEKLFDFSNFIERFGYRVKLASATNITKSINQLLKDVKGKPEQNVVETLAIRSMAKAEYTTENIGHYGLSFDYYTHFTSPIRRYPDIMVHRLLQAYLDKEASKSAEEYEDLCEHASERERRAAQAERQSIKYKQVEFMKDKIGQVCKGVISGVTEWGIYVELNEFKTEGMVRINNITDDHYIFDEANYCLIGRRYKRKFQLGDDINIIVSNANLEKKQLDFLLVEEELEV